MLVAVLITFAGGYWTAVKTLKPIVITNTEIVEKIVEKEVFIEKKSVVKATQKNKKKTTKITQKADGSKEITIVEDNSQKTDTNTIKDSSSTTETASETKAKSEQEVVTVAPKMFKASALVGTSAIESFKNKELNLNYGVGASMRLFGPIWVDTLYQTQKHNVSIGISVEF